MKTLYLVGGTMGVGKTTVCELLKERLDNAVFLDGDWCWNADPFHVTEETKAIVLDNICHLLNNFLRCSAYENILFCWVMDQQSIWDDILSRLDTETCTVRTVALVCDETALRARLQKDIESGRRTADITARSLARLSRYADLDAVRIDTSHLSPAEVCDAIRGL